MYERFIHINKLVARLPQNDEFKRNKTNYMSENRFAILIGMNNYVGNELPYCIKDVEDVEKVLISHCRFTADNIHKITDSKKPVKEQIDEALTLIEKDFKKKEDLLFFYFSGHGYYDPTEEKSKILFEDDTELTMQDILIRYFYKIAPKNQYLLIDACHSGAGVYFKGDNPEKEIRRLNYNSSELCLMFATESKKKAVQSDDIENSYFTYFLLEAIKKDSLYDEDGYLTIQAIDNYLKKKVLEKSDYIQIPVSEIRSSGYKIFSFNEPLINSKKPTTKTLKATKVKDVTDVVSNIEIDFEVSLSKSNREKEQTKYSEIIDSLLQELLKKIDSDEFDVKIENPFYNMDNFNEQKIYSKIIQKAKSEEIEAINGLFEIEQVEKAKPNFLGGLSSMANFFFENSKPDYNYKIYTSSDNIYCTGLYVTAKNIYQVSCGIAILLYQTKYGFAIALTEYNFDWDGQKDNNLRYTNVTIKPFLLNKDNSELIREYVSSKINNFDVTIKSSAERRKKDIENFITKAKK